MAQSHESSADPKNGNTFTPEAGRPGEMTSRSMLARRMIIMEEFSEHEVKISAPSSQDNPKSTEDVKSGTLPKRTGMFNFGKTGVGSAGSIPSAKESQEFVTEVRSVSEKDLHNSSSSSAENDEVVKSSPIHHQAEPATNQKNIVKPDAKNPEASTSATYQPDQHSPKKSFKGAASVVNHALVATRSPRHTRFSSHTGSPRRRNVPATMNLGSESNLRRKSFSVDGVRCLQVTTIERCVLYDILRPLFIAMKIAGMFYVKPPKMSHLNQSQASGNRCSRAAGHCKRYLHRVYCWSMCVLFSVNCAFTLWALVRAGDFQLSFQMTFEVTWCIIWFDSAMRTLFSLVSCVSEKKNLKVLLVHMEKVCYADHIVPYEHSLSKFMWSFLILSFLGIAMAFGTTMYGLFFNEDLMSLYAHLSPFTGETTSETTTMCINTLTLIFMTFSKATALLSTSMFTIMAYILYKEFEVFCRSLSVKITPEGDFPYDLEKFRLNHEARCKLVETMNGIFKYYLAILYLTNTPPLCLLCYSLLENGLPLEYKLYGFYWICWFILQIFAVSTMAIKVNTKAHAPLAYIHGIKVYDVTQERQFEISVFMNRLTGTCIGLTAWDLFVINKPTMLTILGLILTYFFLLVQFRNPLTGEKSASPVCQCVLNITRPGLMPYMYLPE